MSSSGEERRKALESQLADEEMELAGMLEELARLEQQIGLTGESAHHLEEAVDLDRRAKIHVQDRIRELKEAIARLNSSTPPRARGSAAGT